MSEKLIYDTPALYNQHMDDKSQQVFAEFYKTLFSEHTLKTIHDCSIGAGGTTLPLAKLGYDVSGSDLNENLLNRSKVNFEQFGFFPHLFIADFRELDKHMDDPVDCVISTGNSLPHVDTDGVCTFLQSASKVLNKNGLLFFDIRNWDAIVEERAIIHAIDPKIMTSDEHISIYLLFNWHDNGSVTFSFATSVDKSGKHVSMDIISCPAYFPLLINDINVLLPRFGFGILRYIDMDDIWLAQGMEKTGKSGDFEADFANIQWYGVLAQKI